MKKTFYLLLTFSFFIACKSENKFSNQSPQTLADPDNKLNIKKGNIAEVESDAVPYVEGIEVHGAWNVKFGFIQDDIYEVQLEKDKEFYIGLMKHFPSEDNRNFGDFYAGELQYNTKKIQLQFFIQRLDCIDLKNNKHGARITMLLDGKESYGCADFVAELPK